MDTFLENAQRILDVARADNGESNEDFALLIQPDGGLHFIMGSPVSIDGAAACGEARTAYHVSRSAGGVRVEGRTFGQSCVLKSCVIADRNPAKLLLRDQILYRTLSYPTSSNPTRLLPDNASAAQSRLG
jgi:hypothetical protein